MQKKYIIGALAITGLLTLSACAKTDIVAKVALSSFEKITVLSDVTKDKNLSGWSLSSPDKTARFIWSLDYKLSAPHDVMIETDAAPFIAAGLDITKLPLGVYSDGKIMVGQSLGEQSFSDQAKKTPIESFTEIVKLDRNKLGYHEVLDHYGFDVGNGNKFEWAKDQTKNDKDIVFILDPKMFIDAGVEPTKIAGWVFAKVEVMGDNGKKVEVDKFLKPFNIE